MSYNPQAANTFTYVGNPNGFVAGNAASGSSPPDYCWDPTNHQLWTCVTTGSTSSAVWVQSTQLIKNALVSTAQSIGAANSGTTYNATAGITLTVAQTTTLGANWTVKISAQGGAVVLAINGLDVLDVSGVKLTAGTGITLPQGGNITITTDGAGTLYADGLLPGNGIEFNAYGGLTLNLADGTAVGAAGLITFPPGMVAHFANTSPPAGWLAANGAAVSRTTYAALFAAIGTLFGAGDGSTTFNLPDLRGVFVRGWDNGRGLDPDRAGAFGTYEADQFCSHGHSLPGDVVVAGRTSSGFNSSFLGGGTAYGIVGIVSDGVPGIGPVLSSGGTETRPKNVNLLACIKY